MFEEKNSFFSLFSAMFGKRSVPSKLSTSTSGRRVAKLIFVVACFVIGLGAITYGLVELTNTSDTEILSCSSSGVGSLGLGSRELGLDEETGVEIEARSDGCLPWGKIFVDIGGAVEKPGVYELASSARVVQVVEIAGGFSREADKYFINYQLNLAKKLLDGDKIYIPTQEERLFLEANQSQETSNNEASSDFSARVSSELISINNATQKELESLPSIGEKRALDIIQNRPYLSLNELTTKEVITEALFGKIEGAIKL